MWQRKLKDKNNTFNEFDKWNEQNDLSIQYINRNTLYNMCIDLRKNSMNINEDVNIIIVNTSF